MVPGDINKQEKEEKTQSTPDILAGKAVSHKLSYVHYFIQATMVASTLALALLSLTAVTSAVVKRDFTDALQEMQVSRSFDARQAGTVGAVNQSIAAIGASLATANNSVVAFDGGIGGLLSVNEAVVNLGTALNQTTTVAESTPLLSPTDS